MVIPKVDAIEPSKFEADATGAIVSAEMVKEPGFSQSGILCLNAVTFAPLTIK